MLDIKYIIQNLDLVKENIKNKHEKVNINKLEELYSSKKNLLFEFEQIRAEQNKASAEISELNKAKKDISHLTLKMKDKAEKIKILNVKIAEINEELNEILLTIPNMLHKSVPLGNSEEDNPVIRTWGEKKDFKFTPLSHIDIMQKNNMGSFERGAKISGSGFPIYLGDGAKLERALINYMLDFHTKKNDYTEIFTPFLVNTASMIGTGQIPKLKEDMYCVESENMYLIPTAEVPVTNFYAGEILSEKDLPKKFAAFSACFRKEAGSYGKDTKGLQRLHQFNKVELVQIANPNKSYDVLEEMLSHIEKILQNLNLPYRIISLCSADTSFSSAKTYDIEVWSYAMNKYLEVSSVSNFEDFQARRANIRYRDKDGKVNFVHTLNGSGLATPRLYIALLEHYQKEDGTLKIPEVLKKYL